MFTCSSYKTKVSIDTNEKDIAALGALYIHSVALADKVKELCKAKK